jgi:TolB protein
MSYLTGRLGGADYDPAWSPDGAHIAYVAQQDLNDEIWVINRDTRDKERLTKNTWEWDKHPSWSPDGSQIVFWSNRETGRRQIWIMNADGSAQRRLLASDFNDWDPVWIK